MKNVKVSICIPTFNQTSYLTKTLRSIHNQSYKDYEVIVCDDSRNNKVKELINEFKPFMNIRYVKNTKQKGTPANWNETLSLASGEYIKILHHDDWFTGVDSLYKFVRLLDDNPDVQFAFSATKVVFNNRKQFRIHKVDGTIMGIIKKSPMKLFLKNYIGSPSATIFRKSLPELFDINLKWLVDVEFYIRVLKKYSTAWCDEDLITTPSGLPSQVSGYCRNNKEIEPFENIYVFSKHAGKKMLLTPGYIIHFLRLFKKYQIRNLSDIGSSNRSGLLFTFYFTSLVLLSKTILH